MEYLNELNDIQREAAVSVKGPSLVIAGAGSGKTRVLTYRIAHLLHNNVFAGSILALTFTNKAAKEMKERISNVVGYETAMSLWMGTFHSVFAKILRYESSLIGYDSDFTIYDTQDSKNLLKDIVKSLGLDVKIYKPNEVLSRISMAKNNLCTPQAYINSPTLQEADRAAQKPRIGEIYQIYSKRCKVSGCMDFDDLLMNTNILFQNHPEVLAKYQKRFQYILVDEYQDTNKSQYLIIKKLAENHNNVCVVGDDAQSIYSFRGAKIENILNFRNDYPNYKLFKLEQNYRSTQNIVDAANSIIANNKNQIKKKVFSENEVGQKIKVFHTKSDREEGYVVANSICDIKDFNEGTTYNDFAILYRTNAQSRVIEETLRKKNIPYKIYGGLSFYQRKEIKDILAYIRLSVNFKDDESLKRIINYPKRGIGKTTVDKLTFIANKTGLSIWDVIVRLQSNPLDFNKGTLTKLFKFAALISEFNKKSKDESAFDFAEYIIETTGIRTEYLMDKTPENVSKLENIQELVSGIKEFSENALEQGELDRISLFLEDVALITDMDKNDEEEVDRITLMTVHSSKGLEFKNVYIVGLEEELFPSLISSKIEHELEEERRLFYVAVTRAEKRVFLSFASMRFKWGDTTFCKPSRFINEIDDKYLELPDMAEAPSFRGEQKYYSDNTTEVYEKPSRFSTKNFNKPKFNLSNKSKVVGETGKQTEKLDFNNIKYEVGMTVEHERFGIGKIVKLEESQISSKATINFVNVGTKQLLLKFAKLKIKL